MAGLSATRARRAIGVTILGAMSLFSLANQTAARVREPLPAPAALVPVATVLNEVKCDYLDFAYSDYARQQRLPLGKVRGTLRLSLSRIGTAATLGVPVAPSDLRLDDAAAPIVARDNGLTVSFDLDPALALNPAGAKLDCAAPKRLARTILDFTELAAQFADARRVAPGLRSPIRYQGQFFLRRGPGEVDVVLVRVDPARVGRDLVYLQSFDVTIETGAASWFADVGPATAEPRPQPAASAPATAAPMVAPRVERRDVPAPAPGTAPRIELRDIPAVTPATRRGLRVPTAPRPAGTPPARRCVSDASGELACY